MRSSRCRLIRTPAVPGRAAPLIAVMLAVAMTAGCAKQYHALPPIAGQIAPDDTSRILGYRVRHDAPDHLALEIEYDYAGDRGSNVYISGLTLSNGQSTGHWSYRSWPVLPGRHWARLIIAINPVAPDHYASDEIALTMYVGGNGEFAETRFTLPKTWRKLPGGQRCHTVWGHGPPE